MVVMTMVQPQLPNKRYSISMWIWDYLHVFLWATYDILINIKNKLLREDFISRRIKIMSPSERRFIFSEDVRAGGYSTMALIKLFSDPKLTVDENSLTELLNHEILHQVLRKVVNQCACKGLDNITKVLTRFNCDDKVWYFDVEFVSKKTGKILE